MMLSDADPGPLELLTEDPHDCGNDLRAVVQAMAAPHYQRLGAGMIALSSDTRPSVCFLRPFFYAGNGVIPDILGRKE